MIAEPFSVVVPRLLRTRNWTQRDLAQAVGVDCAHISRLLAPTPVMPSANLRARVAEVLDVDPAVFIEHRAWLVAEAARHSAEVCERLYRSLRPTAARRGDEFGTSAKFAATALMQGSAPSSARAPREGKGRFSRAEIVAAILRWNDRYGEPPKSIDWDPSRAKRNGGAWRAERHATDTWPTLAIVRRQFGTMSAALSAAGLCARPRPTRPRGRVLTSDDIIASIQQWDRLYGEPPAMADWAPARARRLGHEWRAQRYLAGSWPHLTTVLNHFGTFGAAVEAAGLQPRPRGQHTREESAVHPDTHARISNQLAATDRPDGAGVLAARVRAVAAAREHQDIQALRGALIDLAAAALTYADAVAPLQASARRAA